MKRTKRTYKIIKETNLTGILSDEECEGCCYNHNDSGLPFECPEELDCSTPINTNEGIKYIVWEIV